MHKDMFIIAITLSVISAYSFSFAIDLFLGGLFGVYPNTAYLPVATWSVIATTALIIALKITTSRRWLSIPFLGFGVLALFGAIVGTHPYSYVVAVIMFLQGMLIWIQLRNK